MANASTERKDRAGPDALNAGQGVSPPKPPAVIVLCGGTSRRFGDRDKTRESLAGTTVLDHLLDGLPMGWVVVCVGPERTTSRPVSWCRESPAGGGPVAGIAAGLRWIRAEKCVVVGGDMPFAAAALPDLVDALITQPAFDAVLAMDPDGHRQPLLAAYRSEALRAALPDDPGGAKLMVVVGAMVTGTLGCDTRTALDVDTPEALEQARRLIAT